MIKKLTYYPDPLLAQQTTEVKNIDGSTIKLLDDLVAAMYHYAGVGLAAPQIGVLSRVCVVDVSEDRNQLLELINPKIIEFDGIIKSEEGCLSIPGYRETIKRHERVVVSALNRDGKEFQIEGTELMGRCFQHELDHLDGILFTDHLSRLKREMFKKWYEKNKPLIHEKE